MALLDPLEYTWYPVSGSTPYEPHQEISGRASPAWERMWLFTPQAAPREFWPSVRAWRGALEECVP